MDKTVSKKVREFFHAYPLKHASKGQVLVQMGNEPSGIFYLVRGQVQQYDIAGNGEQIVVNVFKPSAFFPMSWAINKTPNQYFYEAASPTEYRLAPAADTIQFLHDNPEVTLNLLARVYSGTDGLLRRMTHLMGSTAHTRLLFELLVQAQRFGIPDKNGSCLIKLSGSELAKRTGLSRETISRALRNLKHFVTLSREGILIHNLSAFEKEVNSGL